MAISSFKRSGLSRVVSTPSANFSDTATGTYTDNGVSYKYLTFTGNGTLTVTKAGFADVLVIGGGGGAAKTDLVTAGGGGGGFAFQFIEIPVGSITVTVGGGGAHASGSPGQVSGANGSVSSFGTLIKCGGGGGATARNSDLFGGTVTFLSPNTGGDGAAGALCLRETNSGASAAGSGCGGSIHGSAAIDGRTNSITNSSTEFGKGGAATGDASGSANTGNAGAGGTGNGGSGVVIIRVKV
jgi:hypothetical protein